MIKKGNVAKTTFLISGTLIALLALIVVVSMPVLAWFSAFSALALEDKLIKNEFDNAYINNDYADWQTISIEKIGTFKIPEQWVLCQETDYYVKNKNGDVIAYAAVVGDATSKHTNITSVLCSIIGTPVDDVVCQYDNSLGINGSNFYSLVVTEESAQSLFHCIRLENRSLRPIKEGTTDLVFIIKDGAVEYEELLQIAEAIIYSYEYSYTYLGEQGRGQFA